MFEFKHYNLKTVDLSFFIRYRYRYRYHDRYHDRYRYRYRYHDGQSNGHGNGFGSGNYVTVTVTYKKTKNKAFLNFRF
jgi:hypothetical protein